MSEITLIGMNNYTDVFANMVLPDGIDREILIDTIILKGGEFEPVWMNPDFLKTSIGSWSRKWYKTFEKWHTVLNINYEPLYNYDRYEEYEDNRTETAEGHDTSVSTGSGETDNGRSAYNAGADYKKHDNAKVSSEGRNSSDSSTDVVGKVTHKAHLYGNIGTTRSQEMVSDEIHLRGEFNVYELIADVFIKEFCIMIY